LNLEWTPHRRRIARNRTLVFRADTALKLSPTDTGTEPALYLRRQDPELNTFNSDLNYFKRKDQEIFFLFFPRKQKRRGEKGRKKGISGKDDL
jgi:hypothetical protein